MLAPTKKQTLLVVTDSVSSDLPYQAQSRCQLNFVHVLFNPTFLAASQAASAESC